MRRPPHRVRAVLGTLALVVGLGAAAGCGDEDTVVGKDTDRVSVDTDNGEVTVDTDEGTFTTGQDLPDGFPVDEVPLIDEQVISGVKGQAGSPIAWSVVMQSSRSVEDLAAEVQKDYAGWTHPAGSLTSAADVSVLRFTDARYDVGVTIARTGSSVAVTYVVKTKD